MTGYHQLLSNASATLSLLRPVRPCHSLTPPVLRAQYVLQYALRISSQMETPEARFSLVLAELISSLRSPATDKLTDIWARAGDD